MVMGKWENKTVFGHRCLKASKNFTDYQCVIRVDEKFLSVFVLFGGCFSYLCVPLGHYGDGRSD